MGLDDVTFLDDGDFAVLSECDPAGSGRWAQCFGTEAEAFECKAALDRDGCVRPDGCRGMHRVLNLARAGGKASAGQ